MFLFGRIFQPSEKTVVNRSDDPAVISKATQTALRNYFQSFPEIGRKHVDCIYDVLMSAPGDLQRLNQELLKINGMTEGRSGEIARYLSFRTRAVIRRDHCISIGITEERWKYAGAPCMRDPLHATEAELGQDAAHSAADGKIYKIRKGLFLDGKWTWPSYEENCKCFGKTIIPGLKN